MWYTFSLLHNLTMIRITVIISGMHVNKTSDLDRSKQVISLLNTIFERIRWKRIDRWMKAMWAKTWTKIQGRLEIIWFDYSISSRYHSHSKLRAIGLDLVECVTKRASDFFYPISSTKIGHVGFNTTKKQFEYFTAISTLSIYSSKLKIFTIYKNVVHLPRGYWWLHDVATAFVFNGDQNRRKKSALFCVYFCFYYYYYYDLFISTSKNVLVVCWNAR